MGRLILKKPLLEDLGFTQKMLSDEKTMAYNHAYGGTVDFPEEEWGKWYSYYFDGSGKRFYRHLFDTEINGPVGEVYYRYDEDEGIFFCGILIMDCYRNKGYGKQGLEMLCKAASENGIRGLYDNIAIDNPSIGLFQKAGFIEVFRNEEYVRVYKEL